MATAVAHEINQPVHNIHSATNSARDDLRDNLFQFDEIEPLLDKILNNTERLHKIINTFQRFARGDRTTREMIDLNSVLAQTVNMFKEQFEDRHITLTLTCVETNPVVYANDFLIEEILINLLTNARDALQGQDNATVWVTSWQTENQAGFRVADNGTGLAANYRPHLFTPFHSTKPTEQGTGLGLYICRKIVTELAGTLDYTDREAGGACFTITLPQQPIE